MSDSAATIIGDIRPPPTLVTLATPPNDPKVCWVGGSAVRFNSLAYQWSKNKNTSVRVQATKAFFARVRGGGYQPRKTFETSAEWVQFSAPPDTIWVISEAEKFFRDCIYIQNPAFFWPENCSQFAMRS